MREWVTDCDKEASMEELESNRCDILHC